MVGISSKECELTVRNTGTMMRSVMPRASNSLGRVAIEGSVYSMKAAVRATKPDCAIIPGRTFSSRRRSSLREVAERELLFTSKTPMRRSPASVLPASVGLHSVSATMSIKKLDDCNRESEGEKLAFGQRNHEQKKRRDCDSGP